MKNFLFINLILSVVIASCGGEEPKVIEKDNTLHVEPDSVLLDTVEKEPELDLILNHNVVEKLTAYGDSNPETRVLIKTTYGNMKVRLFNETPLHRANFVMLAKKKFFDSTKFYRIIDKFMIQGGNSDDEEIANKMLAIGSYKIPNEINSKC